MTDKDTTIVSVNDVYGQECLDDAFNQNVCGADRKPQGYVKIFEIKNGKKQLVGKHNLVVYQGREWIAERIFNVPNPATTMLESEFISWLGVGDGGAPIGTPLTPTAPDSTDTDLGNPVPINATDAACAEYTGGAYYKHPFDSVYFEQDTANGNKYLIVKVTTTIADDDANSQNLNEAGLFTSSSTTGGHAGPFYLFSRVTFPTIVKDSTRQLMFMWFIYV